MRFLNKYTIKIKDIPKYTDFNSGFSLTLDKRLCEIILQSDDARLTPEMKTYFQKTYELIDTKTDKLKVSYVTCNGVGRRYGNGLLPHSKFIKNTVYSYLGWKDYDQKKGHPTILLEVGLRNNLVMKAYEKYIDEFDEICNTLIEYYSVDGENPITKSDVKDLFNITIYGGGHSKWVKNVTHNGLNEDELLKLKQKGKNPTMMKNINSPHEFYIEFLNETKSITDKIWCNNDELKNIVCIDKDGNPMVDDSMNRFSFIRNKLISQFCGIIENEITYRAYKYVCDNHKEIKKNVDWGYDGFTVPPTFEKIDCVRMNLYVRDKTKFEKVTIVEKPFQTDTVLNECIDKRKIDTVNEEEDDYSYYGNVDVMKLIDDCSDYGIMNVLTPVLRGKVVYCNKIWWGYNPTTGKWVCEFIVINLIMNILIRDLTSLKKVCSNNSNVENIQLKDKIVARMGKVSEYNTGSNVVKLLCSPLRDDVFIDKLDDAFYKMVFQNGILDLKTLDFKFGFNCDDYITKTIPYDYVKPTEEDEAEFMHEMKKVCNWNDDHLNYYMSHLGYAMTSDSSREQCLLYIRGVTASNGKSLLYETLCEVAPNYVKQGSNDIFDKGADLRKDVHSFRGLKILWLDELSTKQKDEDIMKIFANGTKFAYKPLYSLTTVQMPISCKSHITSNNTINVKADNGFERRFDLIQFDSHFSVNYPQDDYENCKFVADKGMMSVFAGRLRDAMIYSIARYSKKYWEERKLEYYPEDWQNERSDDIEDNNKFKTWFYENYEIDCDGVTYRTDIEEFVKVSGKFRDVKIKDEIKRIGVKCVYSSQKKGKIVRGVQQKGEYCGFKKIIQFEENNGIYP
jgi:hypothetical protein